MLPVPVSDQAVESHDRTLLGAAFHRPDIIRSVNIGASGALSLTAIDWWEYWRPLQTLRHQPLLSKCASLHQSWERYIRSGFSEGVTRYCHDYWSLLDDLVVVKAREPSRMVEDAVAATIGFECFALVDSSTRDIAAATSTLRNPVYLLARLWPTVPHTTRFLPIVALKDHPSRIFGHYRRYPLEPGGEMSLLVYPGNRAGGDVGSLRAIGAVANRLGVTGDPFFRDRSQRLWNHVFEPLLEQQRFSRGRSTFDFVDLGAGSGALTAELSTRLVRWAQRHDIDPRLRIQLIDSIGPTVSKRLKDREVERSTEVLSRIPTDYRSWLVEGCPLPRRRGLRFGLVCKVLDMSSYFKVRSFTRGELRTPPADNSWFDAGERSPADRLRGNGSDRDGLLTSSHRFAVDEGHVFAQPALSTYFAGMPASARDGTQDAVHLPTRRFDPGALVTKAGTSVLIEALNHCDYVVIEDADLRPQELLEHARRFNLTDLTIQDMTRTMRLAGNYAYVLSRGVAADLPGANLLPCDGFRLDR